MVIIYYEQRMLVFFLPSCFRWVKHDNPLEAAEVDRWLLMRKLQLFDDFPHFIKGDFSAHTRERGCQIGDIQCVDILMVEILVKGVEKGIVFVGTCVNR